MGLLRRKTGGGRRDLGRGRDGGGAIGAIATSQTRFVELT